jgi:hypothetical protein
MVQINRETVSPVKITTGYPPPPAIPTTKVSELTYSSFSWRAVFAGVFISLMVYLILTALGVAVGSSTLRGIIQGTKGAGGLGIGAGIWMVVSTLVSLFAGSYVAGRVGGHIPIRVGRAEGLVIASLFFLLMIGQVGSLLGSVGAGLGKSIGAIGATAGDLSKDPRVQDTIESALGNLKLKSPPADVAQGIALRLLRGDSTAAKNYLARQAGISPSEADRRLNSAVDSFQRTIGDAAAATSRAVAIAGWSLFATFLLGAFASMLGGAAGARVNLTEPFSASDQDAIQKSKVA